MKRWLLRFMASVVVFGIMLQWVLFFKTSKITSFIIGTKNLFREDPEYQKLLNEYIKNEAHMKFEIEKQKQEQELPPDNITLNEVPQNLRIVIITTWRSGSTFFAEILNAHPHIYYHYEPLTYLHSARVPDDIRRFNSVRAIQLITEISRCIFDSLNFFISMARSDDITDRNLRLMSACEYSRTLCTNTTFQREVCLAFPIHLFKIVRLPLKHMQSFFEDAHMEFKVVYLVRDPRGIMNSRIESVDWCVSNDCASPKALCEHMKSDIEAVERFQKLYSGKIFVVRYEDLAFDPYVTISRIYADLGLRYSNKTRLLLDQHTKMTTDDVPWSTYRKPEKRTSRWQKYLDPEIRKVIETECQQVFTFYNYTL